MWSGRRGALREAVRVLPAPLVGLIGRRVVGAQALAFAVPRFAAVGAEPEAAARDAEPDDVGVARVDEDRVNAGIVGAAADPELAVRMTSKGFRRAASCRRRRASGRGRPESCRTRARRRAAILRAPTPLRSPTGSACCASDRDRRRRRVSAGYCGTGRSSQVAPPSRERFIFTPKWPMSWRACNVPSRSA